jgi:shikimate kinase
MRQNIVLTGFMATGKTTVGRLLADELDYQWVDTDAVIERRHGPIAEIFKTDGEETFRAMERELAVELAEQEGLVISTGGRMMLDAANVDVLCRARVFCLTAEPEEIARRIGRPGQPVRPLLEGHNPAVRIAELLAERQAGYDRFEQVRTDGRWFSDIVSDLVERLTNEERD